MDKDLDCIICGSCVVDVLVRPVDLDVPIGGGRLVEAEPLELTTGGIVSNSGITLTRLGMRAAAFSYVGDDGWAEVIRRRYAEEGLSDEGLLTHATGASSTTAVLIDPSGELQVGIPLCPPEGDAGTGMVATNSVAARTGNVSAGDHRLEVSVAGKLSGGGDLRTTESFSFSKGVEPKLVEITLAGREDGAASIRVGGW